MSMTITGCITVQPVQVQPSDTPTPATTRSAEDAAAAESRAADKEACSRVGPVLNRMADNTKETSISESVEGYAAALTHAAYDLGTIGVSAGAGSEAQVALNQVSTTLASASDAYLAARDMSAANWLAIQTSVARVTMACGLPAMNFQK